MKALENDHKADLEENLKLNIQIQSLNDLIAEKDKIIHEQQHSAAPITADNTAKHGSESTLDSSPVKLSKEDQVNADKIKIIGDEYQEKLQRL